MLVLQSYALRYSQTCPHYSPAGIAETLSEAELSLTLTQDYSTNGCKIVLRKQASQQQLLTIAAIPYSRRRLGLALVWAAGLDLGVMLPG